MVALPELTLTRAMDWHWSKHNCTGVQELVEKGILHWRYRCRGCGKYTVIKVG